VVVLGWSGFTLSVETAVELADETRIFNIDKIPLSVHGETRVTISTEERKSYQTAVSDFWRQTEEDTCLTRAIQNITGELGRRHNVPELEVEHERIKRVCDYKPHWGASTDPLPESLNDIIQPHGYTARIETEIQREELADIVETDDASLPIVELSPAYLHHVEGYDVQAGMHGEAMPHTVVVFTINHETIQFFDPFEDFYSPPQEGGAPPSQLPKSKFYQWWSGRESKRWTMWVEQVPQQTLDQATKTAGTQND
jgi:hypothetical protein